MTAPATQQHATSTNLLAVLFPRDTGYLKVVTEGSQRAVDYWFRRSPEGAWIEMRHYGWRERPATVEQFLAAQAHDVRFSPVRWSAPAHASAPLPPAAVWCGLSVGTLPPTATSLTVPRVDAAGAERAQQRLAKFSPEPSVVVHEGDRLAAIWLLTEPLADLAQLEQLNRALARALEAVVYVPPAEALLAVPGTRNTRLHPVHTVECIVWQPERRHAVNALALPSMASPR
jgi:hypothetical protein